MTKRQKQQDRLFANPPPTNFTWDDLVSVMRRNEFSESCGGGSHYMFQHVTGFTFTMSKTHPSGILKSYQVKDAREALRTIIESSEEEDE